MQIVDPSIPRVQPIFATLLSLVSHTYLRALPPILGQNCMQLHVLLFNFRGPTTHLHGFRLYFEQILQHLKTFERRMRLKEQHPTELQSRNTGPRSNKTNGISCMHPRSRGSFCGVRNVLYTFTIFAWFRRVNNCVCCFSIFSTPHLFALFAASLGFKQSLQLFYL